jgi:hypothetical protein
VRRVHLTFTSEFSVETHGVHAKDHGTVPQKQHRPLLVRQEFQNLRALKPHTENEPRREEECVTYNTMCSIIQMWQVFSMQRGPLEKTKEMITDMS